MTTMWMEIDMDKQQCLRVASQAVLDAGFGRNHEAVGKVRIDGEVWTARCFDEDCVLEPGTKVQVVDIKGATALVML